ncbi:hypothetical protein BO221_50900 [Archangium sp. Cb G35]|uniref:FAD-dependent oxidoreductase n=1 Tax=Archangium sp. Cb G35 TaxID=1920190 RepID=UPI000935799D|nr:FAD-dependent oxidoreductase [Archangium sp. Cb G35]OJT16273.1 hypothetical protein BO221_50900 [Archangium sp. Cb G35]
MSSREIISAAQVDDRLFVLGDGKGGVPAPVSIDSQQIRALNLVHALFELGKLKKDDGLCVVGAGFAGLTVAAYAAARGARVTVLEKRVSPLKLQRECGHRWIQPYAVAWPEYSLDFADANFPVLNWQAGLAQDVVAQVEWRWEALRARFDIQVETLVTGVRPEGSIVHYTDSSGTPRELRVAATVVAVGFGLEAHGSYWEEDGFEAPRLRGHLKFAIVGLGDGALADVLRIRLGKPEKWLTEAARLLEPMREELSDIENPLFLRQGEAFSEPLERGYEKLQPALMKALDPLFRHRIRSDTHVTLLGTEHSPFSARANALNRVLLWALLKMDTAGFQYVPIQKKSEPEEAGKNTVRYVDASGTTKELTAHHLIRRFGPTEETLKQQFPKLAEGLTGRQLVTGDRSVWVDGPELALRPSDASRDLVSMYIVLDEAELQRAKAKRFVDCRCAWWLEDRYARFLAENSHLVEHLIKLRERKDPRPPSGSGSPFNACRVRIARERLDAVGSMFQVLDDFLIEFIPEDEP